MTTGASSNYNRCNGMWKAALRYLVCRLNDVNDDFCRLVLAIAVVGFGWRHVIICCRRGLALLDFIAILFLFNLLF